MFSISWELCCSQLCPLLPPLTVHGGEHEGDVGGEEIVHLVPEGSLTEEATPSDQVADGHVEVVGTAAPVRDLGE